MKKHKLSIVFRAKFEGIHIYPDVGEVRLSLDHAVPLPQAIISEKHTRSSFFSPAHKDNKTIAAVWRLVICLYKFAQ